MTGSAIAVHHPKELLRTVVSDGSITLVVSGGLIERSAVDSLCAELDVATALCRGIVTVDLTDCTGLGMAAMQLLRGHLDKARVPELRYRFRLNAGRSSVVRALAAAGILTKREARRRRVRGVPRRRDTGSQSSLRTV
jgi:hypothetical protein